MTKHLTLHCVFLPFDWRKVILSITLDASCLYTLSSRFSLMLYSLGDSAFTVTELCLWLIYFSFKWASPAFAHPWVPRKSSQPVLRGSTWMYALFIKNTKWAEFPFVRYSEAVEVTIAKFKSSSRFYMSSRQRFLNEFTVSVWTTHCFLFFLFFPCCKLTCFRLFL